MRTPRKPLVLLAVSGLLLLGCGDGDDGGAVSDDAAPSTTSTTAASDDGNAADVQLTADDDGKTVELQVGETAEVTLTQCGGCGYSWRVVSPTEDDVVELTDERDLEGPPQEDPPIVGRETQHVKTFRATGEGTVEVSIGYFPPGEEDEPEETVTFTVEVSATADRSAGGARG